MFSRSVTRKLPRRIVLRAVKPVVSRNRNITLAASSSSHARTVSYMCRRTLSTPAPQLNVSDLDMDRYHELSDATMGTLLERLEDLLDDIGNDSYEVDYHSGVLTLSLGASGTYVINKQPPNKQIWLSSPFSGPKRYDYFPASDDWRYLRDGQGLGELLNGELSEILTKPIDLKIEQVSTQVE
ncbi:hypothetical protein BJ138DRAFT_1158087 [Hygrophoropsis aurantiaca]|uniref:Uncharacterized protein n=1 Tax=Hygrophoropsis aurantiaca TaxID=72124 RepID=A0ACB8A4W2_9AGAM|nr:hypothetical protein BJ138DRAFT_1158087 [Hygrophoropsis aurantiaca]